MTKRMRTFYNDKVSISVDFIANEEDIKKYEEKNITTEIKEDKEEGCKIEFCLDKGELIGALITDVTYNDGDETIMDKEEAAPAYEDFNKWLNS